MSTVDVARLEALIGVPVDAVKTKVLPHMIPGMAAFHRRVRLVAVAGETVELVTQCTFDGDGSGGPVGTLAMVPGINETLRVNGVGTIDGLSATVTPRQTYMHCAKAFVRSDLWRGELPRLDLGEGACDGLDDRARAFLAVSPFAAVGTTDGRGGNDCSPRGDPPGFAYVVDDSTLVLPERPGNKLADTLKNVIASGRIALRFLAPGSSLTLGVTGTAAVIDDGPLLAPMTVREKAPIVGIRVDVASVAIEHSAAVDDARPWDTTTHAKKGDTPTLGRIYADEFFPDQADEFTKVIDDSNEEDQKVNLY